MTGIQKAFVFTLSASAAAGGTYGAYVGARRVSGAARAVALRHEEDAVRPTFTARIRDIARETWSPAVTGEARGSDGDIDPATIAELQREGIDLAEINELRAMHRDAVTAGHPVEKMRLYLELKRRLVLAAARERRAAVAASAPYSFCTAAVRTGRDAAVSVLDAVTGVWDRLLGEVDR